MKRLLYIFIMLMVFSSCEKDAEYVYDESPNERVAAANAELTRLLTDSEFGWKTTLLFEGYFIAGDFFLFKFDQNGDHSNGNVTIANGFDTATSEFEVFHEVGTLLKFNTRNDVFYWLATPNYNDGTGLGADIEYIFEKEEDGKLYFTGKAQGGEMVLEKASEQDWDMSDIQSNIESLKSIFESGSAFTAIRVTEGINGASEEDPFYLMMYLSEYVDYSLPDKADIFYNSRYYENGERVFKEDASFVFDHEGILLSNPTVIDGDTINRLVYNSELDVWEVGNEGIVGQLITSDLPLEARPGFFDDFINKICTSFKGWLMYPWKTSGNLKVLYEAVSYNYEEPRLQYFHCYTNYVSPDGEELGVGIVFNNYDGSRFAFIPIDIVKLGENKFKLVRTDSDVVSNIEGAVEKIATDDDVNAFLDLMCSDKGWIVDAEYHEMFGLWECTYYSIEDPASKVTCYNFIGE